ncbi:MAG: hypothetical protein RLZZ318_606 [Bacteroidota bacterium]|jgi:hypothetical protein
MNKVKFLNYALLVLFLANLAWLFLFLNRPKHRPEGPKQLIIDQLQFDAEQVQAYDALIQMHRTQIRSLDDSIQVYKSNLYRHLDSKDSLLQKHCIEQINAFQRQIENTHLQHFVAIRQLCKPEQQEAFVQLQSKLADWFKPHKK